MIKQFYPRFARQRAALLDAVDGIADTQERSWYVQLLLSRLMLLYFLQQRGLLDGDTLYLRRRFDAHKAHGNNHFYAEVLCPLCFAGLACTPAERASDTAVLLGDVPYLPTTLFQRHPIEQRWGAQIRVPDDVWPPLFDFFDGYNWQLGESSAAPATSLTPDILDYVFEQGINQKQLGAYYTKADVTAYIAHATIVPVLLDELQQAQPVLWEMAVALLRATPARYIPAPVRHGLEHPLPPEVAVGVREVAQRQRWNESTPATHGLPGEIWRDTVARRARYATLLSTLRSGNLGSPNDLVALNIDLQQLMLDMIAACVDTAQLWCVWTALSRLRVLDPTCGSGAFLLAALALLEPFYSACLERLSQPLPPSNADTHPFSGALPLSGDTQAQHRFVLASIVANNLYGVDLMPEAVELCRLRLLLKLVAYCNNAAQIAALPDVARHICTGNALVGFVAPPTGGLDVDELDRALAREYGVDCKNDAAYQSWLATHRPLHWCALFPEVLARGGFDVVLGNPPYLGYNAARASYGVRGYATEGCANLYAFTVERALTLVRRGGRCGVIVPIASVSTEGMAALQKLYAPWEQWHSHYAVRPGKLFAHVDMNLTISLLHKQHGMRHRYVTGYRRWSSGSGERHHLFATLAYTPNPQLPTHVNPFPKLGSPLETAILQGMLRHGSTLRGYTASRGTTLYYHSGGRYWRKALLDKRSSHYKPIILPPQIAPIVFGLLNSQLFYWYWISNSNCMDVVSREVLGLPVFDLYTVDPAPFAQLMHQLLDAYAAHAVTRARRGQRIQGAEVNVAVRHAKPVLDALDTLLAQHYGLDDEALDFVLHYDIKFRLPPTTQ